MAKKAKGSRVTPKGTQPRGFRPKVTMDQLARQAEEAKEALAGVQSRLGEERFTGASDGGEAEVELTGHLEVVRVRIDPEAVDPERTDALEGSLARALGRAVEAQRARRRELRDEAGV